MGFSFKLTPNEALFDFLPLGRMASMFDIVNSCFFSISVYLEAPWLPDPIACMKLLKLSVNFSLQSSVAAGILFEMLIILLRESSCSPSKDSQSCAFAYSYLNRSKLSSFFLVSVNLSVLKAQGASSRYYSIWSVAIEGSLNLIPLFDTNSPYF